MFRIGQKVVCVGWGKRSWDTIWSEFWHPINAPSPVKGEVYTVANILIGDGRCVLLELRELPSPADDYWEVGWLATGFRPVVENAADISFAHRILRSVTRRTPALQD